MLGDTWHDHVDATWNPRGVTHGMSYVVRLCEWLTLNQVSSGGNNNERKEKKRNEEKMGEGDKCHVERRG